MALERALAVTGSSGRVIVVTGEAFIPHVAAQAAKLKAAQKKRVVVIGEPVAKNTAPAIACAAVFSRFSGQNRKMLVLTSDHIIKPIDLFLNDAALAVSSAGDNKLVVFGITPSHPETGYGYIESGGQLADNKMQAANKNCVLNVTAFHEKPDLVTAKKYLAGKKFFWNSGMFAFGTDFVTRQFIEFAPEAFVPFEKLKEPKNEAYTVSRGVQILNNWAGLKAAYNKAKSISFDFAIAEKCKEAVMVRASFGWIDIGNWEEYSRLRENNDSLVFNSGSENCFVDSDIPVALAGVDGLIVVIRSGKDGKPASALITRKGQTQKVRDVVEIIKSEGKTELL